MVHALETPVSSEVVQKLGLIGDTKVVGKIT